MDLQLGVNGYSFIVDNNGRILYHPDLRPLVSNFREMPRTEARNMSGRSIRLNVY